MLESVTRSGWLDISGFGSGSHMTSSLNEVTGGVSFGGIVLGFDQHHVSSRRLARTSTREGIRSEESIARHLSWMKDEMAGWRKRATGLPNSLSLSD